MVKSPMNEEHAESIILKIIEDKIVINRERIYICGIEINSAWEISIDSTNGRCVRRCTIFYEDIRFCISPIMLGDDEFVQDVVKNTIAKAIVDGSLFKPLGDMLKNTFANGVRVGAVYYPKEEWLYV